ncbi:MAG: bifunctional pyr operon transcriptional regulator/uracil phosphoribosyltransferase PyrR [Phycisphaerales bacterium]|nr:bifunctional pyr operon transcriptional regulator/uracil phosphoribosyltransferase PyrR [Phycisphaerales bacterium]
MKTILKANQINLMIKRLAFQLMENYKTEDIENTVFIGLQPRGGIFAERIIKEINGMQYPKSALYGKLDITFYRDDIRQALHLPNQTSIAHNLDDKRVVFIDDVLFTGRSIRAGLDAMLDFGRPKKVELCILIDRRFRREYPIQPDYVGKEIDTINSQKVKVLWKETDNKDEVVLI